MAKNKPQITSSKAPAKPSAQVNAPKPAQDAPRVVTMTREQERAAWAYAVLDNKTALDNAKDLRTLANGLPATMLRSGLLGALAFTMRYQNKRAAEVVLDALVAGLRPAFTPDQLPTNITGVELAKQLTVSYKEDPRTQTTPPPLFSEDDYILATREALHLVTWLKRAIAGDPRYSGED
jgi:CRISPR/Cas system CMR-associated protein Cmr5 small subunit